MQLRTIPRLVAGYVDRWDARLARRRDSQARTLVAPGATALPDPSERMHTDFDRSLVADRYQRGVDLEGRLYNYVLYPGTGDALCVHFSAFFGEWGDKRAWRPQFQGYFHRLRMFWPLTAYNFLFVCDTFGPDRNGTYYKGEDGDFFVERAMDRIIHDVRSELGVDAGRTVTAGSSMGATAALRFALRHSFGGAIAVTPHIDLDLSARYQGRTRHVAGIVGRDDLDAPDLAPVMREVRQLADHAPIVPRIVIQSMRDDLGVHEEQVVPFAETWTRRGGALSLDIHDEGGHTSEYATPAFFERSLEWCLDEADHGSGQSGES